jgi:molybdopterin-guanine dinucleotide biosynthesis protein A
MPLQNKYTLPGTFALVGCGGNSSRMGTDKSMLKYYEKEQRYHVYEMLQPFCERVFISCNEAQANTVEGGYAVLTDLPKYKNIGPMAALLTAFTMFPEKDTLLMGCDYPFFTSADLQYFSTYCKPENAAVSFYNEKEELYEPLLAWYQYQLSGKLKKMADTKQYSLQNFLIDNRAEKFYPGNKKSITSVDTNEAFIQAHDSIKLSHL